MVADEMEIGGKTKTEMMDVHSNKRGRLKELFLVDWLIDWFID